MTSETRYKRSDQQTVNGLTAYILGTAQSAVLASIIISAYSYLKFYIYKRASDGTETSIGNVEWFIIYDPSGEATEYSFTWDCPETSLQATDAIVVRMYGRVDTTETLLRTWVTEQLGATQLDAVTWTFYVWTQWSLRLNIGYYRHGISTANSRIENFTWSIVALKAGLNIPQALEIILGDEG